MLDAIFAPRAVAVIGASPDPARLGHRVLRNIIDHGYAGRILPIHPRATAILGLPSYPKVSVAPGPFDLADQRCRVQRCGMFDEHLAVYRVEPEHTDAVQFRQCLADF